MSRLSPTRSVSIAIFRKSNRNSRRCCNVTPAPTKVDRDSSTVTFTPHLVPMNRGILSTAYCRLKKPLPLADVRALYQTFYKNDRFIRLSEDIVPNPRYIKGSNYCDIGVYADQRAGWLVTVAALDNLVKGAAGQAIQAMNLMLGLPEETGLTAPAAYP